MQKLEDLFALSHLQKPRGYGSTPVTPDGEGGGGQKEPGDFLASHSNRIKVQTREKPFLKHQGGSQLRKISPVATHPLNTFGNDCFICLPWSHVLNPKERLFPILP